MRPTYARPPTRCFLVFLYPRLQSQSGHGLTAVHHALGVQFRCDGSLTITHSLLGSSRPLDKFSPYFPFGLFPYSRTVPDRTSLAPHCRCICFLNTLMSPHASQGVMSGLSTTLGAIFLGCVVSAAYVFHNCLFKFSLSVVSQTRCRIDVFPAFSLPIISTRNWIFGSRRWVYSVDIGAMKFGKGRVVDVSFPQSHFLARQGQAKLNRP
jgi:hypothetical protein